MASSVLNRQNSSNRFLSTKSQSQYSIQRLPTNKAWPASSQTQFSDVLRASPLRRAASNTQIINQSDSSNSAASRFSLALLKTRSQDGKALARKRRFRAKTSKPQAKLDSAVSLTKTRQSDRKARSDGLTPLKRFRRAARLVKLLVTVSNVCRDLLVYAIKDEQWYEFCEKFLKDASAGGTPLDTHSFVIKVKDPVTKEIVQLEFDSTQFKHDYHSGSSLLTKEIRDTLTKRPGTRTQKEIETCVQCIKRLVPSFRGYTYEQQKKICQLVMYDKYFQERVILRENLPPDGVYFVLSGTLMESGQKMSAPKIIKPGDKFGEEDLKSGMMRQSNVVTKSSVDLLYLHKFDYEDVFELSVELTGDEYKIFDVCKQELVFKYYPISELVNNPARWQVLKFKYGRLIASDSCQTECIYVVRSGEARVMKYMETRTINVAQRRRRLQKELESADPYVTRKKLLDFVSVRKPQTTSNWTTTAKVENSLKTDCGKTVEYQKTAIIDLQAKDIDAESKDVATEEDASVTAKSVPTMKGRAQTATCRSTRKSLTSGKPVRPHTAKVISTQPEEEFDLYRARKSAVNKVVPPFVQVDSLHAGQTYGMRSLLPPEIQGEPAALVSAGCEVIQINKKFFARYLDDNMMNIIALKAKAYPSEDELLKRLDVNLQWEEYCAIVMCGYLDSKVVGFRGSHIVQPQ